MKREQLACDNVALSTVVYFCGNVLLQMDAEKTMSKIRDWVDSNGTLDVGSPLGQLNMLFTVESKFKRFDATVDVNLAARLHGRFGAVAYDDLRQKLHHMNYEAYCVTKDHISAAVSNVVAQARYRFVDPNGLRLGGVTSEQPLVNRLVSSHLSSERETTNVCVTNLHCRDGCT